MVEKRHTKNTLEMHVQMTRDICNTMRFPLQYIYGMSFDRWRDRVLSIFVQPRFQFTKPIAPAESLRAPAPYLLPYGVAVPPPRIVMVCALTGGGITFCQFLFSQGFNSQNPLQLLNPCAFLLHLNASAPVWSCLSATADSYGMRFDRWRDHV